MDKLFAKFANITAKITGSPPAFLICVALVLVWAVSGPLFGFSETWQLVINTGTTIVTFLMVFLIQNTQNRDGIALQTKLDELIRATTEAENEFIGIEKLTDKEPRGHARPLQGEGGPQRARPAARRRREGRAGGQTGQDQQACPGGQEAAFGARPGLASRQGRARRTSGIQACQYQTFVGWTSDLVGDSGNTGEPRSSRLDGEKHRLAETESAALVDHRPGDAGRDRQLPDAFDHGRGRADDPEGPRHLR
ncbi:low affinity iron permease family protein [Caulobacter segnis]